MSGKQFGYIFLAALVLGIIGRIVYPSPPPVVEIAPEELFAGFTNSMLMTLVVDLILIVMAIFATRNLQLIPRGFQNVMEAILEALYNLFKGINAQYVGRTFPLVATIFLFVIISNYLGLLPGAGSIGFCHAKEEGSSGIQLAVSEPESIIPLPQLFAEDFQYTGCQPGESIIPLIRPPSTDLSFTLALAVIAVVWVEYLGFSALGIGYLGKFFNVREGPIMFAVGLLELISEIARIPAFMFRLFGNIFAGEVLIIVMIFLIPLGLPIPIYLFEVFVGFFQAFIFAVLTMAFVDIAVKPHTGEHH